MIDITENKIPVEKLYRELNDTSCGALVTFEGRVRTHNDEKKIKKLDYECYKPMALKELEKIKKEALSKWKLKEVSIIHRVGHIPVGEIAVWISAMSPHREEAFNACRFIIDKIKSTVPIWKRETYDDDSQVWV